MQWPIVIGPPTVLASHNVLVNLLPTGRGVAGHIDLGDNANATGSSVGDDPLHITVRVGLASGVGVLEDLRVLVNVDGPGLVVSNVPVQDIHLGESKAVDLFLNLLDCDEVTTSVDHDTTIRVVGVILDGHGLLNNEAIATLNDNLLQSGKGVKSTPGGLGSDVNGAPRGGDSQRVALIHAVLQVGIQVGNLDIDGVQGCAVAAFLVSLDMCLSLGGLLVAGSCMTRERLKDRDGLLNALWHPSEGGDGVPGAVKTVLHSLLVGSITAELQVQAADRFGAGTTPRHLLRSGQGVNLDSRAFLRVNDNKRQYQR